MEPRFQRITTAAAVKGLYLLDDRSAESPKTYLYFLRFFPPTPPGSAAPPEPPASLAVRSTWKGPTKATGSTDAPGWYVFVDEEIGNKADFERAVQANLPAVSRLKNGFTRRAIAWIPRVNRWVRDWVAGEPVEAPPALALLQHDWRVPTSRSIVSPGAEFVWSDSLGLGVPGGSRVDLSEDGVPRFEIATGRLDLRNRAGALTGAYPPEGGARLAVPLAAEQAGGFAFRVRWDPAALREHYGADFRYVVEDGSSRRSLRYPLFFPVSRPSEPARSWGCDMWLHPFHHEDSRRTRLAFDLDRDDAAARRSRELVSRTFLATSGNVVALRPKPPAVPPAAGGPEERRAPKLTLDPQSPGFALVRSPVAPGGQGAWQFAMAPVGRFVVEEAEGVDAGTAQHLMCGLAGTEYLVLEPGNEIEFVPGRPAVATGFRGGSSAASGASAGAATDAAVALTGDPFTTSWARIHRNGGGSGADGGVVPSYCAQPSTASYFAKAEDSGPEDYPVAVGVSLRWLGEAGEAEKDGEAESPVFPLVPYGAVFGRPDGDGVNPNPAFDADTIAAFEKQAVEPRRRAELVPGAGPRNGDGGRAGAEEVAGPGPIFFNAAANTPFEGGAARTPIGLIAQLNPRAGANGKPPGPAGSWRCLKLAQSPQKMLERDARNAGAQYLELTPNDRGVVNPTFSYAALRDELFMVVTNPELLWPAGGSGDRIQLGDFVFKVDVGAFDAVADKNTPTALAVFKFAPGISLEDLVAAPELWTAFLGDGDVAAHAGPPTRPGEPPKSVQERLRRYLEQARADETGLYDAFNSIAADPNWSGLLVFNCPLAYESLPPDIQILLGGIDGALRAHHFGITINRVKEEAGREISIRDSSLFAVIDYNADFKPPGPMRQTPKDYPNFQVLNFNVEYANSKLVVFKSTIAFSLDRLCGNPVRLAKLVQDVDIKPTGTIVIEGVYTLHEDGTGSLVFSTDEERVFLSTGSKLRVLEGFRVDDATLVPVETRRLADGSLDAIAAFRLDGTMAFKEGIGGDLFSYGKPTSEGFPDRGLVISDYGFAMTTHIPKKPEPGAPPATLGPILHDLSALKVDQELSEPRHHSLEQNLPSKIETLRHVPGGQGTGQTGSWQVKVEELEHTDPHFMLQFKVPLGSLGGLVSSTSNLVADLHVGWKPGGDRWVDGKYQLADDEVGVVLVLPPAVAGADGFNIQGIVPSAFDAVCLDRQSLESSTEKDGSAYPYCLRFENYRSRLLGIPLSYLGQATDLGIFGAPGDPGGEHSAWFVGASVAPEEDLEFGWELTLPKLPEVFIGRSFAIDTDPTDPKVIDDAISDLNALSAWTVAQYMQYLYAHHSRFSSAAGMTFALKFEFLGLSVSMLFHDNDFYGAKIKFGRPSEEEEEEKKDPKSDPVLKRQKASRNLLADPAAKPERQEPPPLVRQKTSHRDVHKAPDQKKKKKGLDKLDGFEFSIVYRKISENLGVWSATIFIDVGEIELGAATLTLPDFAISIWTNGDWRLAVGWPLDDNPITVQFQAGPIPVIGKLGFYLAKLSSEAAPSKFVVKEPSAGEALEYPPNFRLIWAFGLGLSAGVGKEWEKGPFSASASLSVVLTVEGFLASFEGDIAADGVDYHWLCASLALVGQVEGKVDFVIISASLSITLTLKLAIAVESHHSTALALTFEAVVEASIKIVFVRIYFSFKKTLTIWETTLGEGPKAKMDGPSFPQEVVDKLPGAGEAKIKVARSGGAAAAREDLSRLSFLAAPEGGSGGGENATGAEGPGPHRTIGLKFLLQSTAVPIDAEGTSWAAHGVATLVLESGGSESQFGQLIQGLAEWLLHEWGGDSALSFRARLDNVERALGTLSPESGQEAKFGRAEVDRCLAEKFTFEIGGFPSEQPGSVPDVAVIPVHPSLTLEYEGQPAIERVLGEPKVPAGYGDAIRAYFEPERAKPEGEIDRSIGDDSAASLLFTEYFVMLARQLVDDLQKEVEENEARNLEAALEDDPEKTVRTGVVANVAGFVSRFLMGGVRLPDPHADTPKLTGLYELTGQQFPLTEGVLEARLVATTETPAWIQLGGGVSAALDPDLFFDVQPKEPPWTVQAIPPLSAVATRFPMNASFEWTYRKPGQQEKKDRAVFRFSDGLRLAMQGWRKKREKEARASSPRGPWLELEEARAGKAADRQDGAAPAYEASAVLLLPLALKTIPTPAEPGGKPGVLPDTYSLVGTDEVHRAYLQALLNDEQAVIRSLDFAVNAGQGKYVSTKETPRVLVRGNLSTSTGGAEASWPGAEERPFDPEADLGPNHADPADSDQMQKFLRLVWECSIVHTGGFYLQVGGLEPEMFQGGEASLLLVVATGSADADAQIVQAEPYHNALVGGPCPESGVIAGLEGSAGGNDPVLTYTASYDGGAAGWRIEWAEEEGAPTSLDLLAEGKTAAERLQGLYQAVSYRVESIGGESPQRANWSRPVTAVYEDRKWVYQKAFPTAPLLGEGRNTYAAIGKPLEVDISIEDFFGNSFGLADNTSLPIVYNDDILGLAHWAETQTDYTVDGMDDKPDKVELAVNFSYGSLLFTLGDLPDPRALLDELLDGKAAAGWFWSEVWNLSSEEARQVLESDAPADDRLRGVLVEALNKLIRGDSIYTRARFEGVALPGQARKLVRAKPTGNLRTFLNRRLLEARYPELLGAAAAEAADEKSQAKPDETPAQAAERIAEERRQKILALAGKLKKYRQIHHQLADVQRPSGKPPEFGLSALVDTHGLLAAEPLSELLPDAASGPDESAADRLSRFVGGIVHHLEARIEALRALLRHPDAEPPPVSFPEPLSLRFELDKGYPDSDPHDHWGGDLRELRVSLVLQRAGVDGEVAVADRQTGEAIFRPIAELAPDVERVRCPITPIQGKSTAEDPTGLEAFAVRFERAYHEFDGKPNGVIKVATGVNSDLESVRFGMPTLWLARWGESGISVDIDKDEDEPVYYAPPPLSTRLITRKVTGLTTYDENDPATPTVQNASRVFSGIDIDRLAAGFLTSVENIFSPEIAPEVAGLSTPGSELYDPYVKNKARLAKEIADTLTQVYVRQLTDRNDPALRSAIATMRQALLNTLENDYGVSTLVQLLATIRLHGEVEPGGGDPPPNLYGRITPAAEATAGSKPVPYNFSPAKLPLHDGKAWLNFLLSMQNPAAQSVLDVDLAYQMGFIEHRIDRAEERYGYIPSSWLTFVRQQDNVPPDDETNTLTAPIGNLRIPIPLRTYPPLPRLIAAKATQDTPAEEIREIQQALSWTYSLEVGLPAADQDTLNLMVTLNEAPAEKPGDDDGDTTGEAGATAEPSQRQPAADLFEGLARYSHEYPQLEGYIQRLAKGESDDRSRPALENFSRLVKDVADTWGDWRPPQPASPPAGADPADADWRHQPGPGLEVWHYRIDHGKDGGLTLSVSANCPTVHWPVIDGYERQPAAEAAAEGPHRSAITSAAYRPKPVASPDPTAPATPEPDASAAPEPAAGGAATSEANSESAALPPRLRLSWRGLYVLDYQSARASAFVERNRNLGGEAEPTNPAFVYQTETVRMPSSVVPLIKAAKTIQAPPEYVLEPGDSLEAGVAAMLGEMQREPEGSIRSAREGRQLKLEGLISYSFRSVTDGASALRSFVPLYLMHVGVDAGEETLAAERVARNIRRWHRTARPSSTEGAISFRLTLFATRIASHGEQLPLVQFQDLSLETRDPGDDELWWRAGAATG